MKRGSECYHEKETWFSKTIHVIRWIIWIVITLVLFLFLLCGFGFQNLENRYRKFRGLPLKKYKCSDYIPKGDK